MAKEGPMAQKRFSREQNLHPLWLEEKFLFEAFWFCLQPGSSGIGLSQKSGTPHPQLIIHLDTKPRKALWGYWGFRSPNCFTIRAHCLLLHLPDTLWSDREKRWPQSWELYKFAQIYMIQKLCRIGKSWKPLRKPEAGEADTFVLNRIGIQQRLRLR